MFQVGCFPQFRKPDRSQRTAVAQRTGESEQHGPRLGQGVGRLGTKAAASTSEERTWMPGTGQLPSIAFPPSHIPDGAPGLSPPLHPTSQQVRVPASHLHVINAGVAWGQEEKGDLCAGP